MKPYCCAMRAHYLIGIVGVRKVGPPPVEVGEYIENYEAGQPRILTRFCPFCGSSIEGQPMTTTWTPNPEVGE